MKVRRKIRDPFDQDKAPPHKIRAVIRVQSAETQDYVSAPPLTSCTEQTVQAEHEEEMKEPSFIPSVVSEPRWVWQMCDDKCGEKSSSSSKKSGYCDRRRRCSAHD